MNTINILKFFIAFSFVYLLLPFIGFPELTWYLKPFLVLLLVAAVIKNDSFKTKNILLLALVFSLLGDTTLLFANHGEIYFIIGLVFFLIAQLIYILLFTKQFKSQVNIKKSPPFYLGTIAILVYYTLLISTLHPKLGSLQVPVMVYGAVISMMLFAALRAYLQSKKSGALFVLIGALFFVSSDSFLAFNKFYITITHSEFVIMSTYLAAQFFIVFGILNANKKQNKSKV